MRRNRFHNALGTFILAFILLYSCTETPKVRTKNDLPKYGAFDIVTLATDSFKVGDTIFHTVEEWSYLNQDSIWINSEDLKGKIWLADFIFTHCPSVCSPMTERMKEINQELTSLSDKIEFLSFSIDPKRDSVARLKEYIQEHSITAKNWQFLTGDQEETNQMAFNSFLVFANEDSKSPGGFAHSPNFILVDENRHVRGVYNGLNETGRKQLIADIKLLLEVQGSSK
ncbi:MAG: SCO family protein [Brumimicrobium sp.]|nr:SCO family protein [Brumimicrobium sp.]MCO5267783.1 SCO family protein [Brumimicrobium sp.]